MDCVAWRMRVNRVASNGLNGISRQDSRTKRLNILYINYFSIYRKGKGMVLYSAVSSPLDRSKRFTLHTLADLFIPTPFSASLGSILAMQQLRNDYSITFPPLSIGTHLYS